MLGLSFSVSASDLALFPDRIWKQGSFWCADRDRSDGTYDDSGYFKYCSCDEHNSEYGDYTSFISYGGTSVMFLLIEMGLVLSVSQVVD